MLQKAALTGRFFWHLRILLEWWFVDLVPDPKAVAAAPICEHQIGQMLI
jgi:hypothetical protein